PISINWKPESTGTGRFGNWLENLVDWNLSRSRYWGTPLPIWRTSIPKDSRDGNPDYLRVVESIEDFLTNGWMYIKEDFEVLVAEFNTGGQLFNSFCSQYQQYYHNSQNRHNVLTLDELLLRIRNKREISVGYLSEIGIPLEIISSFLIPVRDVIDKIDLHRPFVDRIIFVDSFQYNEVYVLNSITINQRVFSREPDLIDVWFDSGAMPYAQWHYPFENKDIFTNSYPADFIAEGVDQTRGWFFTLHAIGTMLFDSVAFKNVISNGLVLDKNGNKMSKSKGNVVNPFETINKFGPDLVRWYMIENAPPWDNLKFDLDGITEVQRRFFGTLI